MAIVQKAEMLDTAIVGSTPIKWVDLHIRPLLFDVSAEWSVSASLLRMMTRDPVGWLL